MSASKDLRYPTKAHRGEYLMRTNALTFKEKKQLRLYAEAHDYFPGRHYIYMSLTDFVKEFLKREREKDAEV